MLRFTVICFDCYYSLQCIGFAKFQLFLTFKDRFMHMYIRIHKYIRVIAKKFRYSFINL